MILGTIRMSIFIIVFILVMIIMTKFIILFILVMNHGMIMISIVIIVPPTHKGVVINSLG